MKNIRGKIYKKFITNITDENHILKLNITDKTFNYTMIGLKYNR